MGRCSLRRAISRMLGASPRARRAPAAPRTLGTSWGRRAARAPPSTAVGVGASPARRTASRRPAARLGSSGGLAVGFVVGSGYAGWRTWPCGVRPPFGHTGNANVVSTAVAGPIGNWSSFVGGVVIRRRPWKRSLSPPPMLLHLSNFRIVRPREKPVRAAINSVHALSRARPSAGAPRAPSTCASPRASSQPR